MSITGSESGGETKTQTQEPEYSIGTHVVCLWLDGSSRTRGGLLALPPSALCCLTFLPAVQMKLK